jgi:hypothetical protein
MTCDSDLIVTDAAMNVIAQSCPELGLIDIDSVLLTDVSMEAFARGCPLLEAVYISKCIRITSVGIKVIAENCRNLKFIDISWTYIGDEGLVTLAECCPKLIELQARFCSNISDIGLLVVASMSQLQRFDMPRHNAFSTNVLQRFANGCSNLKILGVLGEQTLNIDFIVAFARKHPDLQCLDLRFSSITDETLIEITQLCPNLRRLSLDGCKHITDASITLIQESLPLLQIDRRERLL